MTRRALLAPMSSLCGAFTRLQLMPGNDQKKQKQKPLTLQLTWPLTQPHIDHWNVSPGSFAVNCCCNDINRGQANTHMPTHTHTYAHSIILSLLFPECQLSLGSFDCIDCNEFSVYMTMNIILLLLLLLLQPLFFCTLPSGSRFYYMFPPSHLQHQKKYVIMMIIIIVLVIRMIIPGLMSVSQFVCNNVARTSQYLNHWKRGALIVHTYGWIFHISKVTCFPFIQTPYDMFGSMNVQQCAPPPPALFPHLLSLCVSCCLSV